MDILGFSEITDTCGARGDVGEVARRERDQPIPTLAVGN